MSWRENLRYQAWRWVGLPLAPLRVKDTALQAAKSAADIARTTAQGITDATGRTVRVAYDGASPSTKSLREFSDGVLASVRRHGRVPLDVITLGALPKGQMAHTTGTVMYDVDTGQLTHRGGEITLNESRFGRVARFALLQLARVGDLPGGGKARNLTTPTLAGAHEVGHVVDHFMAHPEWKNADVLPAYPKSLRRQVVEGIAQARGKSPDQVNAADVAAELGLNASTDFDTSMSELVADADADATINGDRAHPVNAMVSERLEYARQAFDPGPGARLQVWEGSDGPRSVVGVEHWFPDLPARFLPGSREYAATADVAAKASAAVSVSADRVTDDVAPVNDMDAPSAAAPGLDAASIYRARPEKPGPLPDSAPTNSADAAITMPGTGQRPDIGVELNCDKSY